MSDLPSDSLQRLPGDHAGLQEHTEFLRRLARGLLLDPGRAEDALQETWLAALRQRGDVSRGWLAVVVRRIAMQMRRSEGRRRRREEENARAEHLPSAAEDAARLELTRRLVEEITALADPYRSVLLERFFDDLSVREIAERRGLPVATVRTQVRRGLQQLREQLLGDDKMTPDVLLTALLPLAGPSFSPPPLAAAGAGTSTGTWTLATIVQANLKLSVALLAVVFLSLVTWNMWPESARSVVEAEDLAFSTAGGQLDAGGTQVVPVDVDTPGAPRLAEREDLGESESSRDEAGEWVVRGVAMRNYDQDPYPGITIAVMRWDGYETLEQPEVEERTVTDDKGRFELSLDKPTGTTCVRVVAEAEGHHTWRREALVVAGAEPKAFELHVLPRDATLIGRVHREDGSPVSGAKVEACRAEAETDSDGRFRITIPSAVKSHPVYTKAEGLSAKDFVLGKLEAGDVAEIEVVMRPEFRIRGWVRDVAGTPLAGARVASGTSSRNTVLTDGAGEYALAHLDADHASHRVSVHLDGFVSSYHSVETEVDGEAQHDFVLDRGLCVSGFVFDDARGPLAGAHVSLGHSLSTNSRDDGHFEVHGVERGTQALTVQRAGYSPEKRILELPAQGERFEELTIVLGAAHFIVGTLTDPAGVPIQGVLVSPRYKGDYLNIRETTDEEGRFRIDGLPANRLALEFYGGGLVRLRVPLTEVDREDLEFTAQFAGRLSGRVVDGVSGEAIEKFRVRFVQPVLEPGEAWEGGYNAQWSGEGHLFTDADGHWDSGEEELRPGALIGLEVHATGYSPCYLGRAIVAQRGAQEVNLIRLFRGATVRGCATGQVGGEPLRNAVLRLRENGKYYNQDDSNQAFERPATRADEAGQFTFESVSPGNYHVLVVDEKYGRFVGPTFTVSAEASEVVHWLEVPAPAALFGRLLDVTGEALGGEMLRLSTMPTDPVLLRSWETMTAADGRYRFGPLPSGMFRFTHCRSQGYQRASTYSQVVVVENGEEREFDLRPLAGGVVSGTLSCATGLPAVVSVQLECVGESGRPVRSSVDAQLYGVLTSSGKFEIPGVKAGRYELSANGDNFPARDRWTTLERQVIIVTDSERVEQRLVLTQIGRYGGKR